MQKGKFIVLEGCDGSGKTSVIELLKKDFKDDPNIIFIKAPGSTSLGNAVRNILKSKKYANCEPKTWLYLFMATMVELIEKEIKPNLEKGKTIICDRFAMSTWVYQNSMCKGMTELISTIISDLTKTNVKVDKTIFLNIDLDTIKQRIKVREDKEKDENDFIDEAKTEFFNEVLTWYNMGMSGLFYKELLGDPHIIDAKQQLNDVYKNVKEIIVACHQH